MKKIAALILALALGGMPTAAPAQFFTPGGTPISTVQLVIGTLLLVAGIVMIVVGFNDDDTPILAPAPGTGTGT